MNARELSSLSAAAGFPVFHVGAVGSTQDWVKARLAEIPPPFAVLADHQTAGRGRRGSPWYDEPGASLILSAALNLSGLPFRPELLPLAVGLAVARELEGLGVKGVRIKWPNDILVGGEKICGILVETVFSGGLRVAVAGMGLNVDRAPFGTCLREHAPDADRLQLAGDLLSALPELGFDPAAYAARDYLRGRRVRVGEVSGEAAGIDASGALVVRRDEGGFERVHAGEVRVEHW
ncbi:biotin--[acetyl-CoA-carboxylase] ligase [Rubrobacter taiwanensis]|uniref:biotin--[acetyl-CoA-carboxylase] ligase n=1 Tax=Rubrobacter taiwanensis TaxID=185139 RepID=UPI0014044DD1|nr:biotin--[acetyl-CoA-carboxylase] ligase [Rubrobacter taiwanensis]